MSGPGALALTVVHHRSPALIGVRTVLGPGESLEVGRGRSSLGYGVLDDPGVSREHARLTNDAGTLRVEDLGSANGTQAVGDLIGFGEVLLVATPQEVRPRRAEPDSLFAGVSAPCQALCAGLDAAAREGSPVALHGRPGSGRHVAALELHRLAGREGPVVRVDVSTVTAATAQSSIVWMLRQAGRGTLIVRGLETARPPIALTLLRALDDPASVRSDGIEASLAVILEEAPDAGVWHRTRPSQLLMERLVPINVPSLRARREDIPLIAHRIATSLGFPAARPDPELTMAMLTYPWPGDTAELAQVVEAAIARSETHGELGLTEELRGHLVNSVDPEASDDR